MSDQPIAITETLFVGPNPPNISGSFVHVTSYEDAADVLVARGMTREDAWERIKAILDSDHGYDGDLFQPSPGQEGLA